MEKEKLYYQESMKVNLLGLIFSYVLCLVAALFLGYAYSVITIFIPLIYINFLITIGFGLALALGVRIAVRTSHNRNKKSHYILAFIVVLMAVVFQWATYILYVVDGEVPSISVYLSNVYWIVLPHVFFPVIAEINEVGMWSILGLTFNGVSLSFIWLLEAVVIMALPIIAVYKTKVYPYSELNGKWYPKYTLNQDFESVTGVTSFLNYLTVDPGSAIEDLGRGLGHRHSKVHVFYHKNENKQYLSLEKVLIEKQGTGKRNSEVVINNFEIDRNTAQEILEKFPNRKERIQVF